MQPDTILVEKAIFDLYRQIMRQTAAEQRIYTPASLCELFPGLKKYRKPIPSKGHDAKNTGRDKRKHR